MSTQIALPLPTAYLEAITNKSRKPRGKSLLTTADKNIINKYKEDYRSKSTTEERSALLRDHILVDIFNFWYNNGVIPADLTAEQLSERIQV